MLFIDCQRLELTVPAFHVFTGIRPKERGPMDMASVVVSPLLAHC